MDNFLLIGIDRVPLAFFLLIGSRVREGEGPDAWGHVVLCVLYMLVL